METIQIEEKTQKGYTLKINLRKQTFIVFDRKGASVYADPAGLKVVHKIPTLLFFGESFRQHNRRAAEYSLLKVSKGKLVVPYYKHDNQGLCYLLLDSQETIDMIPVRILYITHLRALIKELEGGFRPDVIIVGDDITENDIIVIRNRYSLARILMAESVSRAGVGTYKTISTDEEHTRATDLVNEVNLNMLSGNPVFLARVHLRSMALVKVRQLLLDFEMTAEEADFVLSFINTMLKKKGKVDEITRNYEMIQILFDEYYFYIMLLQKNMKEIERLTSGASRNTLASYLTLLAKVRSMTKDRKEEAKYVDIENLLLQQKELLG